MRSRRSHVQKTKQEKQHYWNYIESQDYEPTKDESFDFKATGQSGEVSDAPSAKYRQINLGKQISEHLRKNWLKWFISVLIILLYFLMVDSKITIAKISTRINYAKDAIQELKERIKSVEIKNNEQDIEIRDNKNNIDFIKDTRRYDN